MSKMLWAVVAPLAFALISISAPARADEGKLRRFGSTVDIVANGESRIIAGDAKVAGSTVAVRGPFAGIATLIGFGAVLRAIRGRLRPAPEL